MRSTKVHEHTGLGTFALICCVTCCARSVFSAASPADVAPADGPESPIAMVVQLVSQTRPAC